MEGREEMAPSLFMSKADPYSSQGRIRLPNQAKDSVNGHVPAWDLIISRLTNFQQANTSANINNQSN